MNVVKQNLFCPLCGAREVYVDKDDPGDHYAGTDYYCMACHAEIPDLGSTHSLLRDGPPVPYPFAIGEYLAVREAAKLDESHAAETERVRVFLERARMEQEARQAAYLATGGKRK